MMHRDDADVRAYCAADAIDHMHKAVLEVKNEAQLRKLAASLEVGTRILLRFDAGRSAGRSTERSVSAGERYRRQALDRTAREHTDRVGDETGP